MSRSPIELLDAVLDEVEGLRQTDPRSHLPAALVRELRQATAAQVAPSAVKHLASPDALIGRTVTHVFDSDLRRGDMLLLCADGGFLVLEAENEGDGDTSISVAYGTSEIAAYLRPGDLARLGLMTHEQRRAAEKQEQIAAAESVLARAKRDLQSAEAAVARLKGEPQAHEPIPHRSAPSV